MTVQLSNYGVVLPHFGDVSVLTPLNDLVTPSINAHQVLIETHFAGINPIDYKTRLGLGWAAEKLKSQLPAILGFDIAGKVVKAGEKSGFTIGDSVVCLNFNGGGYSRYVAVDAELVCLVPKQVSLLQAGALPTAGITALQLLRQANLTKGQKVVISAPLGGVGHLVMQLLLAYDVEVIAICSAQKIDLAKQLGATTVIDYTQSSDYPKLNADIFFDLVGGEAGVKALNLLKVGARVICVPTIHVPLLTEAGQSKGLIVESILAQPNQQDLAELLALMAQGKLSVHIAHQYPWFEVSKAHQQLEQGRVHGKIVVDLGKLR